MLRSLIVLGVLAGCAAPPAIQPVDTSPSPAATVALSPLAAVQQADLPPALRPSSAPMDHSSMAASSMDHSSAETPLSNALTAYLVIHSALANDTIEGVSGAAHDFVDAFGLAIEDAPADDPHLWHMRADETTAVQAHASSLVQAADLVSARAAFGELSAPFASLIEAVGSPEGFDLVRHTCGMQSEAPEGGVWLQRAGDVQNPYFGGAMQICSREHSPVQNGAETDPTAHAGMNHGS